MFLFFIMSLRSLIFPNFLEWILDPLMVIVVIIVGIIMALGAVGIKFNGSISAAFVNNIFAAIGYVFRIAGKLCWTLFKGLRNLTPKLFREVRDRCLKKGKSKKASNLIATIVVVVFWLIII